jgi:hypothetical protein
MDTDVALAALAESDSAVSGCNVCSVAADRCCKSGSTFAGGETPSSRDANAAPCTAFAGAGAAEPGEAVAGRVTANPALNATRKILRKIVGFSRACSQQGSGQQNTHGQTGFFRWMLQNAPGNKCPPAGSRHCEPAKGDDGIALFQRVALTGHWHGFCCA